MTAEEKTEWLDACAAMLAPELPSAPAFISLGVVGSYITLGGNTNTQGSRDGAVFPSNINCYGEVSK